MTLDAKKNIVAHTVLEWFVNRYHEITGIEKSNNDVVFQSMIDLMSCFGGDVLYNKLESMSMKDIPEMECLFFIGETISNHCFSEKVDRFLTMNSYNTESVMFDIYCKYTLINECIELIENGEIPVIKSGFLVNKKHGLSYWISGSLVNLYLTSISRKEIKTEKDVQSEIIKFLQNSYGSRN